MKPNQHRSPAPLNSFFRSDYFGYLFLLTLSLLAFIPLIKRLGFYWDDWSMLWFEVSQGPQGFAEAFTGDRPFLGFLYRWTGKFLSVNPLGWQLLTVFFRWLVGCAFLRMLRLLWKEKPNETLWIASVCAVYSGFKQMPIAYVWGNAFILLFFYLLSYVFMLHAIRAFRSGSRTSALIHTLLGVVSYLICTLCTEYYTGLDLARIVIVWILLRQDDAYRDRPFFKQLREALFFWFPYLTALAGFMIWRVFVFRFPSYQPVLIGELTTNPFGTLIGLVKTVIQDVYTATWGAWIEFFRFPFTEPTTRADFVFWVFVAVAFLIALVAFHFVKTGPESSPGSEKKPQWTIEAGILGLSAVILPGLPYVVTDLSPALTFPRDRWLTAYMFGSAILLIALIDWIIRSKAQKIFSVSLVTAFMVGGNILNANRYARDWQIQKDFIGQLQTRIPALETPTYLFTDYNPLSFETDNSLTGMVNLGLFPENSSLDLPVAVGFFDVRFERDLTAIENGAPIYHGFRSALYHGNADDMLVYFYSPPGCLRILDPAQHTDLPIFPKSFYELIPYSNLSRIGAAAKPRAEFVQTHIFKQPIDIQSWCYAFQKADFARQNQDWAEIAKIGDEAFLKTEGPMEASELIPFIEAYAKTDQWSKNAALIRRVHAMNPDLDQPLCKRLQALLEEHPIYDEEIFNQTQAAFYDAGCSLYASDHEK